MKIMRQCGNAIQIWNNKYMITKKPFLLSASIICANSLDLKTDIQKLEDGGIDYLHFDIMDGAFVPRLGLFPEMLASIKTITKIPISVHLMIENPDNFIPIFINAGADMIIIHAESTRHLDRSIRLIKKAGIKVGVALNPATSLSVIDYVLDDIDLIMLMAINPGLIGHALIPGTFKKISDLKNKLRNYPNILIEIDGGVTFKSAPDMIKSGANMLVCGSSTIFRPEGNIAKKTTELRQLLK